MIPFHARSVNSHEPFSRTKTAPPTLSSKVQSAMGDISHRVRALNNVFCQHFPLPHLVGLLSQPLLHLRLQAALVKVFPKKLSLEQVTTKVLRI